MSEEQKYVKTKDGTIIIFQAPILHSKMRHIADIVSAGFICFGRIGISQCKCYGRSESLDLESDPKDTEIANKQLFGIHVDRTVKPKED
jgi:hypothetical protein